MTPEINSKTCDDQTPNMLHFHSCSVDDDLNAFGHTDDPSRNYQHGTDMGDIKVNGEMKPLIRNVFYKQCDEPEQPQRQVSAKQDRHNGVMNGGRDSDSDEEPYQLDGIAVLPELVKLTLAQHRVIRSLIEEADIQRRITNARLDLVDEELSFIRSSLAEQPVPSLFSGFHTRTSFEGAERDRADDYIPEFDLTDIGVTLAAGPSPWGDFGPTGHRVRDGTPSPRPSKQRRRSPRPERYVPVPSLLTRCLIRTEQLTTYSEEHVKRTRISYDGLGGQDPKTPPSTCILSTPVPRSTANMPDETSQPSLLGKLCGKMAKLLLGS